MEMTVKCFKLLACLRVFARRPSILENMFTRRLKCGISLMALMFVVATKSYATITDGNADIVLGQADLVSSVRNVIANGRFINGESSADGGKISADSTMVYVVDKGNSRVLFWYSPEALINGKAADGVIGQANFEEGKSNRGGAAGPNTLNKPCGIFHLQSNFVWIADCGNNRILRFSSPPTIGASADIVLGQANFSSTGANRGGSIAANTLNNPVDVTRDDYTSDIWVTDTGNHRVLKYNSGSLASGMNANVVLGANDFTTAGWGDNGTYSYSLNSPKGISIDGFSNVWVADFENHRALKFTAPVSNGASAGIVLGQADFTAKLENRGAGFGAPAANSFSYPGDVTVSGDGNTLWIADTRNHRLVKYIAPYTNGKDASLVLGTGTLTGFNSNFIKSTSTILFPNSVSLQSATGDIWTIDAIANTALKFNNPAANGADAGLVLGSSDFVSYPMNSTQAKGLYIAKGVAYDPKYRRYFITDSGNQRVLWWNSSSALTTGRPADGVLGQLNFTDKFGGVARNKLWVPMGLAVDASGNLWVADEMNNRVVRYPGASLASGMDADLVLGQADFTSRLANRGGPASANTMSAPQSIGVGKNGDVWVAERDNHRVLGFSATGLANGVNADFVLGQADFSGSSSNRGGSINADTLSAPTGVYVDNNNRVWVADLSNRRVLRFDSPSINKDAALVLGQNDFISNTGGGGQNKLTWPAAVILDYFANVWVADRDGNRIIKYTQPLSNGMLASQVIGQADYNSYTENRGGSVGANTLWEPLSLALDNFQNLYTADAQNNRVAVYNSGLSATTLNPYVSIRSSTSLMVSWNVVTGANYVAVLFADANYANVVAGSSGTQSGNLKIFTGLSAETTYYFQVKLSTETDIAFSFNRISTTTLLMPPSVSAITPSSGTNTGPVNITNLAGADFLDGATVKLTKTGQTAITASNVVWVNSTQIACSLPLTDAVAGTWNIVVTNPDFQSGQLADGFTIKAATPTLSAVTPNTGANNGYVAITNLAGTGFQPGAAVKLTRTGELSPINAVNMNVLTTLKITCDLPLIGRTTGTWDIVVTNPDEQNGTLVDGFTITYPVPTIVSITPKVSVGNTAIRITNLVGTGFQAGTTVKLAKAGQADINGTGVKIVNATMLTCDFDLSGAAAGGWDVVITVPGQQPVTLAGGFTVLAPTTVAAPAKVYQGVFNPAKGDKSYIATHLSSPGKVTVKVYDPGGRLVRDIFEGERNPGDYSDEWDGRNKDGSKVASGIYLIRIEGPGIKITKRVLAVK